MTNLYGDVETHADVRGRRPTYVIDSISSSYTDTIDITHDDNFYAALSATVVISSIDRSALTGNVRAKKPPSVDFLALSKRWGISPHKAKRTLTKTTQRGVRRSLTPELTRRFPTNDRMLRYRRLPHNCFMLEPSPTGTYVRTRYLKFHLGRMPRLRLHTYLLTLGFQ